MRGEGGALLFTQCGSNCDIKGGPLGKRPFLLDTGDLDLVLVFDLDLDLVVLEDLEPDLERDL